MNYDRHQCILAAINALRAAKSWTGKTHVQKSLALASLVLVEELPFEFVLYKHGPYSFDVDYELDQMLTYDAVKMIPQGQYGPTLKPGMGSAFPEAIGDADPNVLRVINETAHFAGDRKVIELESLATAAWIRVHEDVEDDDAVQRRLIQLKPHLAGSVATAGVKDSRRFVAQFCS